MRDLDTKKLRSFLAIAEAGSFVKASSRLNVAQPALSQQILNLEEYFDARLFSRSHKGVELTEAGALLVDHAHRILATIERARETISELSGERRRRLKIILPASLSRMLAPELIAAVARVAPDCTLGIHDATGDLVRDMLTSAQLVLGLCYQPIHHDGIVCEPLLAEPLYLVSLPLSVQAAESVPLRELHHLPLVLPAMPNGMRETIDTVLEAEGVVPEVLCEFNTLSTMLAAVDSGIAPTLLPIAPILDVVTTGRYRARRVVEPEIVRTLYLATSALLDARPEDGLLEEALLELIDEQVRSGRWAGATLSDPARQPRSSAAK